ncbi:IPT/TIG domain-containing protein [Bacteroides sp.]|uniref:IPT/TIG domain-containing protein n=1 Tax=Bacteroides sp. TaxID=29523 RepID=UPI0025B86FD5|nr:IPT/TIG domain-containing protein [Bacteroides sp.]
MRKILLIPCFMLALFSACNDNEQEIVELQNPDSSATVTSILPQRGVVGTLVTINGTNFGASKELVKVYFTGIENEVTLIKCEDKELQVQVPEGTQTGPLTVKVMEQTIVTDMEFQVIPDPEITAISIQQGYAGDELKVTGNYFGTTIEDVKLYSIIDDEEVEFEITACTETEITAKIPAVTVFGEYQINLSILGRSASNVLNFEFLEQAAITSIKSNNVLSEQFAFEGDEITISGTGFGDSTKDVEVLLGTVEATVTNCTNTEIKATVPAGFTGGKVSVTRNGRTAESTTELQILTANTDISEYVLKNYKQPFNVDNDFITTVGSQNIDKWSTPADWIITDNVKSLIYSDSFNYGGLAFDNTENSFLCMQYSTSWGGPSTQIQEGKMYQVVSLPKGKYKFVVNFKEAYLSKSNRLYIVGSVGDEININDEIKVELGNNEYKSAFTEEIELTNNGTSNCAFGFVGNLTVSNANFKVNSVSIIYLGND